MNEWTDDASLFSVMKTELFSAVIGDVMDRIGLRTQFLPPHLSVIEPGMVIAGRARTVLEADVHEERTVSGVNPVMTQPFGLMFEALDSLRAHDVYICTGASPTYALWGGLMSTRARHLDAAGAVVDGYVRDTNEILSLGFPVAARGSYAQDQGPRGKVIDYDVPLTIGGVRILPGDIVYGDRDGVLVVPQTHETEVIRAALEKVRGENEVRQALEEGMSTVDAFKKFGIM